MARMKKHIAMLCLMIVVGITARAQDISQNANSDPLIITGAIGTNNTYNYSSAGMGYSSPLSNSFYANLNISIYGISMPFSLYYTNDNTEFSYPHISFNLNPRYKNWQGHLGLSSMEFSEYVMSMSFNGVGLEYNDNNRYRVGAFYGVLRKAVNDDPNNPSARDPQYKRMGWGFKVGYGTAENYLDLYFLRAYDKLKSLDEHWQRLVSPQDNVVVGLKGALHPLKFLSLQANAAMSAFSTDTRVEEVPTDVYDSKWGSVFDVRYSSLARFAGDVSVGVTFNKISAQAFYRLIQPDFTSLGLYYMSNNYHSLGLNLSTTAIPQVSLAATFSGQADNLSNKQLYTTKGYVYAFTASTHIGNNLNLMAGYNGYTQKQSDGTAPVNDTTRIDRITQSITFVPSYSFDTETLGHGISLSTAWTQNKDRNPFSTGETDVTSLAASLSYSLNIKPWETDLSATLSHQESKGYQTKYISNIGSLTIGRSFLSERELSVALTGNLIYNEVKNQSKSLSMGFDCSVGYTLLKVHNFSLQGSMNRYGDVNVSKRRSSLDTYDISATFNYAYTFSLFEIKRKNGGAKK